MTWRRDETIPGWRNGALVVTDREVERAGSVREANRLFARQEAEARRVTLLDCQLEAEREDRARLAEWARTHPPRFYMPRELADALHVRRDAARGRGAMRSRSRSPTRTLARAVGVTLALAAALAAVGALGAWLEAVLG